MKQAIVWTSFGVTDIEAGKKSIGAAAQEIAAAFPAYEVREAYTANFVRRKLREQGVTALSLEEVLGRLAAEGYEKALVQPSHLTPGEEYENKILPTIDKYQKAFVILAVGKPLFAEESGCPQILATIYGLLELREGEAAVLLGHGSPHRHNPVYENLQRIADENKWPLHIGVVERGDTPNFSMVLRRLKADGCKNLLLAPLLVTGGVHVTEDMAGNSPDSWKSRLEGEGFSLRVNLRGLAEYPAFRKIYVDKLAKMAR
ncbi:MAG: sirohydrochlorin cobaltochelatase [Selenomonadaceae bacterium]|nr:sirohydrochlorin cobaltochelatase [Selenomonadaceae bacterium]